MAMCECAGLHSSSFLSETVSCAARKWRMSSSGGGHDGNGSSSSGSVHSTLQTAVVDDSVYANVESVDDGHDDNRVVMRHRSVEGSKTSHLSSADAERIRARERELEKIHRRSRELMMPSMPNVAQGNQSRESSPDSMQQAEDQVRPAVPPKPSTLLPTSLNPSPTAAAAAAPPPPPKSAPPPLPPRQTFGSSSRSGSRRTQPAPMSLRRRVQSPHRRDFKDFSRHPRDSPLRLVHVDDEDDSGADSLDMTNNNTNVYHPHELFYSPRRQHTMHVFRSPPCVTPYDPHCWMGVQRVCEGCSSLRPRSTTRPPSATPLTTSPTTALQVMSGVEERLLQLEGDKDQLHLQVALLSDQVESQTDKIASLERMLDDKKVVLQRTEDVLQREMLTRSSLETKRLELLSEISGLKLKQASMEKENVELRRELNDALQHEREQPPHHPPPAYYGHKTRLDAFGTLPRRPRSRQPSRPSTTRQDFNPADMANDMGKLNNAHGGSAPSLAQQHVLAALLPDGRREAQQADMKLDRGEGGATRTSEPPPQVVRRPNRHRSVERSAKNAPRAEEEPTTPFGPIATKPKGLKKFLGKMRRANSGLMLHESPNNDSEPQTDELSGQRSSVSSKSLLRNSSGSAFASLVSGSENPDPSLPLSNWRVETLCAWLDHLGLYMYAGEVRRHVKSGRDLLNMTSQELESKLGMRHSLHRKKVLLALQAKQSASHLDVAGRLDHQWVTRWLDDLGLPQYKDAFLEARVDGRVLNLLTVSDLVGPLRVTNLLHHLSIRRAVQVLRQYRFEPTCLKRRASPEDRDRNSTPIEVAKWTNHRVMEWLRHVDLAEYAANLRGSGVHGALLVLEPRFTSDLLASLLAIPGQKSLLRRHLGLHFAELVGPEVMRRKREAQHRTPVLTATAKVRTSNTTTTTNNNNNNSHSYNSNNEGMGGHMSLRRRVMDKWRLREKNSSNSNTSNVIGQQEHDELDFEDLLCPLHAHDDDDDDDGTDEHDE